MSGSLFSVDSAAVCSSVVGSTGSYSPGLFSCARMCILIWLVFQ